TARADTAATPDERMLREAKVPIDGPGLLEFFRQRTVDAADETRLKTLVRQLGDDSFEKREEASRQLVAIGARALPILRQASTDSDIEVVRRAQECLRRIEQGTTSVVLSTAVHVLGQRKPPGAVEVLLAYLPSAEDESVAEEIRITLTALALRDGKPEPALV